MFSAGMSIPAQKRHRPLRHAVERVLDAFLLDGRVAAWSYRRGLHGQLAVARHEVALEGKRLPAPLTIAFASDFHAGPTTHWALYDDLAAELRRARPDVLLLGGDYVSFDAAYVGRLGRFLASCDAPLGTYAVIGNHDIWNGRAEIEDALHGAGVKLLVNRNLALPAPFDMVSICGIDDPWTGQPSPARAFAHAREVRVFVTHAPDGLCLLHGERFDVGFAGHTHAGQVAWASGQPVRPPRGPLSGKYFHGRFEVEGNGPLVVSSGIGCSGVPLRWNTRPELVLCTLR
jgi:predicted MPP superfamily phosphohydrolase